MREIPLTQGKIALVDDADYPFLSRFNWWATKTSARGGWYAGRTTRVDEGPKRTIYMHQQLLPECPYVDHRDRDGLHNWRENLRAATQSQNMANARMPDCNSSGFKGVRRMNGRWSARIKFQGREQFLGMFDTAEEAAHAYDETTLRLFGEFARLNFSEVANA